MFEGKSGLRGRTSCEKFENDVEPARPQKGKTLVSPRSSRKWRRIWNRERTLEYIMNQ